MYANSKINKLIIFITYFSYIIGEEAAVSDAYCGSNYKVLNWEFDDHSLPPAVLTQNLTVSGGYGNQTNLEVWLIDRREDFNLTIFADPFVKNDADCPRHLREHKNIRQFFETCTVFKDHDENVSQSFSSIFTGCYYFVMTNKEGKNWQHGPVFYNTSYRYLDTKLELLEKHSFQPEDTHSTMKLRVSLTVPLSCIRVKAVIFQHEPKTENALEEIKNGRIPGSQKWFLEMNGEEVKALCETSTLIANLTLDIKAKVNGKGWTGTLIWGNLRRGGGNYYLHFAGNPTSTCPLIYGYENINTWKPIDGEIWKDLGFSNSSNVAIENQAFNNNHPWFPAGCGIVGVVVFAIISYWAWKYREIILDLIFGVWEKPIVDPVPEPAVLDCKESEQILLLYEKGPPEFMEEMRNFRDYLTQHCRGCSVHDVYAINEWNRVSELGASGWVLELLENGSKVVWVDTPEFRYRLNDKEKKQYARCDFRDNAVPYAVCIARDAFVNSITQYRRHFVVRVRGYEVCHGDTDPLKVVSPHARYYIPENLSLLCEHLKGPMELLDNRRNSEEKSPLQGKMPPENRTAVHNCSEV